jgi:hypothetical protein
MQKAQMDDFIQNQKKTLDICILCHNFWTNQNLDPAKDIKMARIGSKMVIYETVSGAPLARRTRAQAR